MRGNRLVCYEAGHEGPLSDVLAAALVAWGFAFTLLALPRLFA